MLMNSPASASDGYGLKVARRPISTYAAYNRSCWNLIDNGIGYIARWTFASLLTYVNCKKADIPRKPSRRTA